MTVGEKIKKIRTFRGLKQRDVGLALGFTEHTADNRMAQYETNYRVPKKEVLIKLAAILDVNPMNFIPEDEGNATEIMQTFFWLEETSYGSINLFQLVRNDGQTNASDDTSVRYYDNDTWPAIAPVGIYFDYGAVNTFMREWLVRQEEVRGGTITRDEYFEWKLNWPDTCDDCGKHEPPKKWRK